MDAIPSQFVKEAATPPTADLPEVERVNVLGVGVSVLDLPLAVRLIVTAAQAGHRGYVCVCGAHGIVECQDDPALGRIYSEAFLVTPDGMPLVWALKRAGHEGAGRVYGPDLMHEVVDAGQAIGLRHFLYGTTDETLARLRQHLIERSPGAVIAGTFSPPFRPLTEAEESEIAARIDASGADIVWVGLSAPKQERWMARMRPKLSAPILIGVGAAFDFHAGNTPQAPRWMQERGLEWAFRFAAEPRRLARRYIRVVPRYLVLTWLQTHGVRAFPLFR